jgi:hypothetical protein
MHDQRKTRTGTARAPFEHLEIAIRVAEGGDRTAPDGHVDPDRLPSRASNFDTVLLPITCSGPVDGLAERAHELDPAAGNNEAFETVGPKEFQHFQHGLIDQFGEGSLESRMPGRANPAPYDLLKLPAWVAIASSSRPAIPVPTAAFMSFFQHAFERLQILPLGCWEPKHGRDPGQTRVGPAKETRTTACRRCQRPRSGPARGRNPHRPASSLC